ncbi:hypothetical protein [Streptomyces eurythermus]|uniref:hypothetical protein n=1 Tax=Streptomyces eurythermus TaxID=42237 RepID=UPI0033D87020
MHSRPATADAPGDGRGTACGTRDGRGTARGTGDGHRIPTRLTDAQRSAHPGFADHQAFTVDPRDRDRIAEARVSRQLIATQRGQDGALLGATTVRLPPG